MLQKPLDIADELEYARLSRNQRINMGIVKRKLDFLQTYCTLTKGDEEETRLLCMGAKKQVTK
jgi:hypothetical protein